MKTVKPSAKLYLTFVNDFLTVPCFAEHLDVTVEQAKSILARSKVLWLSEDKKHREYFTNNWKSLTPNYNNMRPINAGVFMKRHQDRLLSEHSA